MEAPRKVMEASGKVMEASGKVMEAPGKAHGGSFSAGVSLWALFGTNLKLIQDDLQQKSGLFGNKSELFGNLWYSIWSM